MRATTRTADAAETEREAAGDSRLEGSAECHDSDRRKLRRRVRRKLACRSCEDRRLYKLRAGRVVLATGALEQPLIFRNNDLPGIMHGSAAQRLLRRYGVRPGTRAVILTANDFGYGVALDLAEAQIDVAAIVDLRSTISDGPLRTAAIKQNFRIESSMIVSEAVGRRRVRAVRLVRLRPDGAASDESEEIDCDLLCMSGGFAPNLALAGSRRSAAHL